MAKFENSQYAKIWDSEEGGRIVERIIANPALININYALWAQKFRIDPQSTPTDQYGAATFTSYLREIAPTELMDMRAPLGDSLQMEKKGGAAYSATIPDLIAKGFVENAKERWYKEKAFEDFGDVSNIATYASEVIQKGLDSANLTLSYMGCYLLSRGELAYTVGKGIHGNLYRPYIPEENFDTAGAKAWTDSTAKILDQMRAKEQKFRDKWGLSFPMIWEIDRKQFINNFLTNAQVLEQIRYANSLKDRVLPEVFQPTEEMAMEAIAQFEGLSPIVLVDNTMFNTLSIENPWKDGVAVLRPAGYAGYIRHTNAQDEEIYKSYGNDAISFNFTRALSGLVTICNKVCPDGMLKKWHTDVWMSAIPSLDEFLYHVIIDTKTKDA